ncbi:TSUP family transporter [Campylobacter troglodytis]|uniref:TSUP family transporter n=1 Tax=Campylobacter troglodytis TaxID=654363 RepID=UPI003CFFC0EB
MAELIDYDLEGIYYFILFAVALGAGFIDSIVGGGGLITLPALMAAGIPSHLSLATNKLQSTFGSLTATLSYFKARTMKHLAWGVIFTAFGAGAGSITVLFINDEHLKLIILIFLVFTFLYMALKPNLGKEKTKPRIKNIKIFHIFIGFSIGFYDGFLGPGTGSFLIFACVMLLGYNLKEASINTKILNFTSNAVALAVFLYFYKVLWLVGILMGIGQMIGAFLGSKLVLKTEGKFIKALFLAVVFATICKVGWDYFRQFY